MKFSKRNLILSVVGVLLILAIIAWRFMSNPASTEADSSQRPGSSLSDYNIVYLLADGADVAGSPLASSNLVEKLDAQVVYTWKEVLARDNDAPIEALIVHASAQALVDRAWLANAYHRGVVITGFSLNGPQVAELVNDPCIARDRFAAEPYPGSFYVIASFLLGGDDSADVALVEDAYRRSCGQQPPAEGPSGYVRRSSHRSTYDLNNDNDFNGFVKVLMTHLR